MTVDRIKQRIDSGVVCITHENQHAEAFMHPNAEGEVWYDGEKVHKTLRNHNAPYLFDVRLKQPPGKLDYPTLSEFMRNLSVVLEEKFQQEVEDTFDEIDSLQDILESDRFSKL